MHKKSTLIEIEERFNKDVARFSNLNTGQATMLDAAFNMELITDCINQIYPNLSSVLDIGCGAGNYDVKLLMQVKSNPNVHLLDLSQPMLDKAKERIDPMTTGEVKTFKGDFRTTKLEEDSYDVIIATAVLHHLRDDHDWETAFRKLHSLLKPGGSIWIFDLIQQENEILQEIIYRQRYGNFLTQLKDEDYRDQVFEYIEQEDSPRSLVYQLQLLERVGFQQVDLLHKNLCMASFVASKSTRT
ncbi:methyltransferase domain-containing protein [Sphingobacterium sp. DK4209]|uniref:Methyltransferase domain-containing protein n=1 Tax=Sphingobacterium zhuxiongii TaxID=2662364 RepID=A0A5Q0Q6F7_9SPHI|nr:MULTISPECIES: class I SAM-dependent methyltransferase [unclassified Sphingobacterium]MVZ64306.1 methyltransferase domain-containing protein [Sphingobacterium sp. DK4209]QGA25655.1 methyltransferase domain-containing protein [Sphingobacterium sp. dk4302]